MGRGSGENHDEIDFGYACAWCKGNAAFRGVMITACSLVQYTSGVPCLGRDTMCTPYYSVDTVYTVEDGGRSTACVVPGS